MQGDMAEQIMLANPWQNGPFLDHISGRRGSSAINLNGEEKEGRKEQECVLVDYRGKKWRKAGECDVTAEEHCLWLIISRLTEEPF